MVPFPEPGAPTIIAQILSPFAAVDEFLLDEEIEVGERDPHHKTPPQMGGRRTKDDSIAMIRKEGPVEGEGPKANNERQFHFLTAFFPCDTCSLFLPSSFHLPEFVESVDYSQVERNAVAQRMDLDAAQSFKAVERQLRA